MAKQKTKVKVFSEEQVIEFVLAERRRSIDICISAVDEFRFKYESKQRLGAQSALTDAKISDAIREILIEIASIHNVTTSNLRDSIRKVYFPNSFNEMDSDLIESKKEEIALKSKDCLDLIESSVSKLTETIELCFKELADDTLILDALKHFHVKVESNLNTLSNNLFTKE